MNYMRRQTQAKRAPADTRSETRDRLLDVAERLFARHGLDAVSVRDITQAAGTNLGAINYHFATKHRLIVAVFDRRMTPVTEERVRALDALENAAGAGALPLEAVLEAMFRPAVLQAMDKQRGGAVFGRLMARSMMEPNPHLESFMRGQFEPVVRRFDAALMRAMPNLTLEDVFWRMHLLMGALHSSLLMLDKKLPDGRCLRLEPETYVRRFVAFAAAAFKAPLPKERPA
jgi:AcrR family transcriptional regulator